MANDNTFDNIVYVDGFKIRNTLDIDFAIIHQGGRQISQPYLKWYIPDGQFWMDYIYQKSGEAEFLWQMDLEGTKYLSNLADNSQFLSYREYLKKFCLSGQIPNFYLKKENDGNLEIVYVDGSIVRRYIDPEFLAGGHEFVYSYIPKGEIWLDNLMGREELSYVLLHEKTERELMSNGKNYDNAHRFANAIEMDARISGGHGTYIGDENYDWFNLSNEEIIKKYVIGRK